MQRAYAAGSAFPVLADKTLRLYSMRFCPYAQRTLLVLHHLNIPHEVININLKHKPDWFLARNPIGLVPVLEHGKKIVYESVVCDEYLDDVYGNKKLFSADPYQKARTRILMEYFGKVTGKFYGLVRPSSEEIDPQKRLDDLRKLLWTYEENISGKFFGGSEPCMLDFHIWPWFERMPAMESITGIRIFPSDIFPRLNTWVKTMDALPAVKSTRQDLHLHVEFLKQLFSRGPIDYDIGLSSKL